MALTQRLVFLSFIHLSFRLKDFWECSKGGVWVCYAKCSLLNYQQRVRLGQNQILLFSYILRKKIISCWIVESLLINVCTVNSLWMRVVAGGRRISQRWNGISRFSIWDSFVNAWGWVNLYFCNKVITNALQQGRCTNAYTLCLSVFVLFLFFIKNISFCLMIQSLYKMVF